MRQMQKNNLRKKEQRKNAPKKDNIEAQGPTCPHCGSNKEQIPVGPHTNVCMACGEGYPRNTLVVVVK